MPTLCRVPFQFDQGISLLGQFLRMRDEEFPLLATHAQHFSVSGP